MNDFGQIRTRRYIAFFMSISCGLCHLICKPRSTFILTYHSIIRQLRNFHFFRNESRRRIVLTQLYLITFKLDTRYIVNSYIRLSQFLIDNNIVCKSNLFRCKGTFHIFACTKFYVCAINKCIAEHFDINNLTISVWQRIGYCIHNS